MIGQYWTTNEKAERLNENKIRTVNIDDCIPAGQYKKCSWKQQQKLVHRTIKNQFRYKLIKCELNLKMRNNK